MPDVVAIGETMVLFTPVTTGPLRYVHGFEKHVGGAESNVCIGVCRLGRSAGWISRVGDDEFGRYILSFLRGEGVDVSHSIADPERPTGVYFKERRAPGQTRVYYYRRGSAASALTPNDLDAAYIGSARFLLLTGITPALSPGCEETVRAAGEMARAAGVQVVFDPNVRLKLWDEARCKAVLSDLITGVDVLLPGIDEARMLTGVDDPEAAAQALLAMGPSLVVVKLGPEGALVATAAGTQRVQGFPIERPVDPVGAGDAFAAGLLWGLLEGCDPAEAVRFGCACGALATTVPGDVEGLPDRSELEAFLGRRAVVER